MAMKKRLTRIKSEWDVSGADVVTLDKNLGGGGDLELKVNDV